MGDCLYETITGLCSGYLVAASAREKKDRMLLAWIQEEVIGKLYIEFYICTHLIF